MTAGERMQQARQKRLWLSILTVVAVLASTSYLDAEVIVFANGRTMSVKDHRISGDSITVTLRQGGEATFDRALVAEVRPDEVPREMWSASTNASAGATSAVAPLSARPFAALIETVALKHGIDPALVHAVIATESNYQPRATSRVGARGLMQVMPATARDLGVRSAAALFDPTQNVEAGVKYLKSLLDRFDGDLPTALAAYNAGPGAVSKHEGIPPYPETRKYVRKVLSNFQQ
jgi:soluble lytic murein transglycosylase-like protein